MTSTTSSDAGMANAMEAERLIVARSFCHGHARHTLLLARTTRPSVKFDASGVLWLDHHIDRSRSVIATDLTEEFVYLMGSFFGECLIGAVGGRWALADAATDELAIRVEPLGFTYPFAAVRRRLAEPGSPTLIARYEAALSVQSSVAA